MNGLSDLDAVRPRKPRPVASRGRAKAKPRPVLDAVRRLRSKATLLIASAGFCAIMVGIVCNAVLFQKGHHPAPLFAGAPAAERTAAAAPQAPRVQPPAPPTPVAPVADPVAAALDPIAEAPAAPLPARHALARPAHPAARPAKAKDGIADLLGGKAASAPAGHGPATAKAASPVVAKPVKTAAGVSTQPKAKIRPGAPVAAPAKKALAAGTPRNDRPTPD